MSWLWTILIAIVSAALGAVGTGFVCNCIAVWHRMSSREGASGYFVVFMGLLGLIVGLIFGAVMSRVLGGESSAGQVRAGGITLGIIIVVQLIGLGIAYVTADWPPTINGQRLAIEYELRLPERFSTEHIPEKGTYIYLTSYGSTESYDTIDYAKARIVDGRWILPGRTRLISSRGERALLVHVADEMGQLIPFPLAGKPAGLNDQLSDWYPATVKDDGSKPAAGDEVVMRYRVVIDEQSR
jgi:hypothetical protein